MSRIGNSSPHALVYYRLTPYSSGALYKNLHPTIVLESETTFTQFRIGLTGLTSINCTTSIEQHWLSATLTAPCQRLNPPAPRRMAHFCSADLPVRSPRWPPADDSRCALHAATTDGDRPRHANPAKDQWRTGRPLNLTSNCLHGFVPPGLLPPKFMNCLDRHRVLHV